MIHLLFNNLIIVIIIKKRKKNKFLFFFSFYKYLNNINFLRTNFEKFNYFD
ncbi:hypothetical protein Mapa_018893 [Marchantia paleacea]|nr:hypothetical protein Mapa_018893 [Marchantia paleacea]